MRKELKKEIVKDIMELKGWCLNNKLEKGFTQIVVENGQHDYESNLLMVRTLMNKSKETLDKIREEILEKVVY